jgi:ribosomal protein S18 acetylase RimI-like enzyme
MVRQDVLDLRHFAASSLRDLLTEETELWQRRLRWDYRASAQLLLDYLDSRILPGFVATEGGRPTGYVFCVYEQHKAVIGDVFATANARERANRIESRLLEHTLELLQSTPGTARVETQLLLHPKGQFRDVFTRNGFDFYPRVFMERQLRREAPSAKAAVPASLRLRPWRESDFAAAGRLIALAYQGHLDSVINDQYRTTSGSLRFLHNIVRFPGCGQFDPATSLVLAHRDSEELAGIVLCSRVNIDTGHVTQLCIAPALRHMGLGRLLLMECMQGLSALGLNYISLTVTEDNQEALLLYRRMGFKSRHSFDAMVWQRN